LKYYEVYTVLECSHRCILVIVKKSAHLSVSSRLSGLRVQRRPAAS